MNHLHESLFSTSTTAYAIGKIWSLSSLPTVVNNSPPYLPFKKQPSTPMMGLHAAKLSLHA